MTARSGLRRLDRCLTR